MPPSGGFNVGRGGGRAGNGPVSDRKHDMGRGRGGGGGGRAGAHGFRGSARGGGRHGGGSSRDDLNNIALPKQDFKNLVPFEKNFYVECPAVRAMSEQEVLHYRASREITVQGNDVPKPVRMFHEANFPGILLVYALALLILLVDVTSLIPLSDWMLCCFSCQITALRLLPIWVLRSPPQFRLRVGPWLLRVET